MLTRAAMVSLFGGRDFDRSYPTSVTITHPPTDVALPASDFAASNAMYLRHIAACGQLLLRLPSLRACFNRLAHHRSWPVATGSLTKTGLPAWVCAGS